MKLKKLVEKSLASGMSQRQLAAKVGVSHGTINSIMAGIRPKKITTLQLLATFYHLSIEHLYDDAAAGRIGEGASPHYQRDSSRRIFHLIEQLDDDEIATLERCAEAFVKSTPDVRLHLIGQLKIIERLIEHETSGQKARAPADQKIKGSS